MDIQETLDNSIKNTNDIIKKWVYIHSTPIHNIKDEEIKSVLLANIKKYLITDSVDFKRFRKILSIITDHGSKYITKILISDPTLYYFRNSYLITEVCRKLDKMSYLHYIDLMPPAPNKDYIINSINNIIPTTQKLKESFKLEIDLKELENIKF